MKKPTTRAEAEAQDYIVDKYCYPWLAYKGPRFDPTEAFSVLTDTETALRDALVAAKDHLDYCGWGDSWEREGARDAKLPERIDAALSLTTELLR